MSEPNAAQCHAPLSEERQRRFFETNTVKANLKSKSLRGGAAAMVSQCATLVITLAVTSVLARLLTPSDFGLLGMVFALTTIAERFKDIGLGRATIQKKELTHSEVSNLFWINAAVGIGICFAIALLSGPIAGFYHEERLKSIVIVLSTTFVFGGLTIQHQALLNRQMKFIIAATIGVGALVVSNVLAIILAFKGYGYWSLVWREIAKNILVAAGTFAACPWMPRLPDRKTKVSQQVQFGRDVTLFNIVTYFTSSVDQILLGKFSGASALGLYRQAFQFIMMPMNQLISPMHQVGEPLFCALQDDVPKYRKVFFKAVSIVSLLTMPLAAGIFACSKPLMLLLLGQRWSGTVVIVQILAVAAFIRPPITAVGFVMISCGKTARYALIGILDSIALATAVGVGVMWGARGVAIGQVVATYIVFLPFVSWSFKGTPVHLSLWLQAIARPAAASVFMVAILSVLSVVAPFRSNLVALCVLVPVGALSYFIGMLMLPGGKLILSELLRDCCFALRSNAEKTAVRFEPPAG